MFGKTSACLMVEMTLERKLKVRRRFNVDRKTEGPTQVKPERHDIFPYWKHKEVLKACIGKCSKFFVVEKSWFPNTLTLINCQKFKLWAFFLCFLTFTLSISWPLLPSVFTIMQYFLTLFILSLTKACLHLVITWKV